MAKDTGIEAFLNDISPDFTGVVTGLHELLVKTGCTVKLQEAKSGHVVSYNHPETKKVVANFVSRKTGPVVRIYADGFAGYMDYLQEMPAELEKKVVKASACRRMLDPTKCNAKCAMGYDFILKDMRQQKCRYNCFMFPIKEDTLGYLQGMLEREMQARTAS